jgi:hypothetical protein
MMYVAGIGANRGGTSKLGPAKRNHRANLLLLPTVCLAYFFPYFPQIVPRCSLLSSHISPAYFPGCFPGLPQSLTAECLTRSGQMPKRGR